MVTKFLAVVVFCWHTHPNGETHCRTGHVNSMLESTEQCRDAHRLGAQDLVDAVGVHEIILVDHQCHEIQIPDRKL